jgi:hypothetical protein
MVQMDQIEDTRIGGVRTLYGGGDGGLGSRVVVDGIWHGGYTVSLGLILIAFISVSSLSNRPPSIDCIC